MHVQVAGSIKIRCYEWRTRPGSAAAKRRELLKVKIGADSLSEIGVNAFRRCSQGFPRKVWGFPWSSGCAWRYGLCGYGYCVIGLVDSLVY